MVWSKIWYGVLHLQRLQKSVNVGPPPPVPLYPQTPNFALSTLPSRTSLTSTQDPSIQGYFEIFFENFNSEINIMT